MNDLPVKFTDILSINGHALIQDISLIREGDAAVVYICRQGVWYEAIREFIGDRESSFSHNITSYGMTRPDLPKATWMNEAMEQHET